MPIEPALPPRQHRTGRRLSVGRLLMLIGITLLIVVAGWLVWVFSHRLAGESFPDAISRTLAETFLGAQPTNILLIGNNARDAQSALSKGQADLIFVAHIDPATGNIDLISIPRNTMVAYPHWNDPVPKIKSAFFMGGPALAVRKVSALTGIPIQGWVVASFQGFEDAVNAVGGVVVNIPGRLYDPNNSGANFNAGVQRLDGAQALAYVRIRQNLAGNGLRVNDFQRMSAAFSVLEQLKRQVLSNASSQEVRTLVGVWEKDVATNLSPTQLVGLALIAGRGHLHHIVLGHLSDSMDIYATAIPGINVDGAISGAYYDILTPAEIERALTGLESSTPYTGLAALPARSSLSVLVTDNSYGATVVAQLRRLGIVARVSPSVPAAGQPTVVYPPGQLPAAEQLGRSFGLSTEAVELGQVPQLQLQLP